MELVNVAPWANCLEGALAQEGSSGFLSCMTLNQPFPPCASAVKELGSLWRGWPRRRDTEPVVLPAEA